MFNRLRIDDIRSIYYKMFEGEFKFTVGQQLKNFQVTRIVEDESFLIINSNIRYLIYVSEDGINDKVWKIIPANIAVVEQFI